MKTLAFFNNKGGVGKTSLVYHIAWTLRDLGHRVVLADLDPQANLTTFCLSADRVESLLESNEIGSTIYRSFQPMLAGTGDLAPVSTIQIAEGIDLIPGDLALSEAEDELSERWNDLGSSNQTQSARAFRTECAFYRAIDQSCKLHGADIALIDVGPNLGPLNRAALVASDYVVIPLSSDAFSLQGLRNVGGRLKQWRLEWAKRRDNIPDGLNFNIPAGQMQPIGYVLSRFSVRHGRQAKAFAKWAAKMPAVYAESVLGEADDELGFSFSDQNRLAELKDYRTLMPMAQDANKPIFLLTAADGAIGAHQAGVQEARTDFAKLTRKILERMGVA